METNILDRIANETDLTKSERKIAAIILKDPAFVINENIAQLAKRAQVSEPSVCRFCKRFGADGFPAFKLVLSSIVSTTHVSKVEGVKQGDSVEDVISKVIAQSKRSLSLLEKNIDESKVARIIDAMSQSRRIIILSQGMSDFAAVDLKTRMLNLGFPCEHYTDKQSMALALSTLRVGDIALCISSTGENRDLIEALNNADNTGAGVIAICPQNSSLYEKANMQIATDSLDYSRDDELMSGRISLLIAVQILLGGIMLRRAIAIDDLKNRLSKARCSSYKVESSNEEEEEVKNDDSSLKSNTPITTLDWHPY